MKRLKKWLSLRKEIKQIKLELRVCFLTAKYMPSIGEHVAKLSAKKHALINECNEIRYWFLPRVKA